MPRYALTFCCWLALTTSALATDTAERRRMAAGVPIGGGVTPQSVTDAAWRSQVAGSYFQTAGIEHIATTTAGSSGGNGVTTTAIDTTGADLIVVSGAFFGTPTLSDSESNTWTALTVQNGSAGEQSRLYYCANPTTDAAHTFTLTGASTFPTIGVVAVSGAASSPFDQENGFSVGTNGTSIQPGSITPSEDGCLVVTGVTTAGGASHTINGTYTASVVDNLASNHYGHGIGWHIQSTAAATNPTWSWTNSVGRTSAIASFKPDTGASAAPWLYFPVNQVLQ
jgi:hypothetical protein